MRCKLGYLLTVCAMLIPAGICMGSAIHDAVRKNDLGALQKILKENPALAKEVDDSNQDGITPLHYASAIGNVEMVRLLIKNGADVNAVTVKGMTPLHWAVRYDMVMSAGVLIENKADIMARTKSGHSPLKWAIGWKARKSVRLLLIKTPSAYVDPSLDVRGKEGKVAKDQGYLASAREILADLQKTDPGNENVNFAYGLVCYSLENYSASAMAFERVLQINPNNERAKLELAYAYFYSNRGTEAKGLFESVLASSPSEQISARIKEFLDVLAKGDSRFAVSGRADVAFFVDDNVNIGPKSDVIDITPIMFGATTISKMQLGEDSQPEDDEGVSVYVGVMSAYDIGDRQGWTIGGEGAFFRNWLNECSERESEFYQISAGPVRVSRNSMLRLPVMFSSVIIDDDPLVDILGTEPMYRKLLNPETMSFLSTSVLFETREYEEMDTRDGYFASLTESYERNITEKIGFSLGLCLGHDYTDEKFYEYTSLEARAGIKVILPKNAIAYARASYGGSEYRERETLAPETREDDWSKYLMGVNIPIKGPLRIDVNHQLTYNHSTFDIYEYDRSVTTVTASVVF